VNIIFVVVVITDKFEENLKYTPKPIKCSFEVSYDASSKRVLIDAFVHTSGASRLDTVPIDHSHSQQPVPRDFPLDKRCEWLVVNRDVIKPSAYRTGCAFTKKLFALLLSFYF